jgi:hypothetical protein
MVQKVVVRVRERRFFFGWRMMKRFQNIKKLLKCHLPQRYMDAICSEEPA